MGLGLCNGCPIVRYTSSLHTKKFVHDLRAIGILKFNMCRNTIYFQVTNGLLINKTWFLLQI